MGRPIPGHKSVKKGRKILWSKFFELIWYKLLVTQPEPISFQVFHKLSTGKLKISVVAYSIWNGKSIQQRNYFLMVLVCLRDVYDVAGFFMPTTQGSLGYI